MAKMQTEFKYTITILNKMKNRSGVIILRIAAIIFSILFLLLLSLHLYLKKNSSEITKSFFDKLLNNKGAIYRIGHNSVDIDLIGGQIVLKNLEISFDDDKLQPSGLSRKILMKASIPLILIKGISASDLIIFHKINAERVLLKNGKLNFYTLNNKRTKKKNRKRGKSPVISIGEIGIEDTDIEFFTDMSSTPKSGLRGINLDSSNIKYDPGKSIRENFESKSPELQLNIKNSFIFFKKSRYKAESGSIRFESAGSSISIKDFKYAPSTSKILQNKIIQKGKFHHIKIPETNLKNIDLKEFTDNGRLKAGQLYFKNPDIYFFRNRNIGGGIKKEKILPQQIFREANPKADLDLIRIKNGKIKYTEIAIGERKGESLIFSKLETSFHEVSNFPEILRTGRESKILISTKIMGKSILKGKMMIPVNNRENRFSFTGSLLKTNPLVFNRFLRRNVKIRIDKGKLNYMTFNVQADRDKASGKMRLSYNNFHVTLMRKKNSSRKSRFGTFLANTLTYKNNPSKRRKKLREGKILFERKIKRSIFNYMWKCLLSGIKSSIRI